MRREEQRARESKSISFLIGVALAAVIFSVFLGSGKREIEWTKASLRVIQAGDAASLAAIERRHLEQLERLRSGRWLYLGVSLFLGGVVAVLHHEAGKRSRGTVVKPESGETAPRSL